MRSSSRQFAAILVLTMMIVVGCGGSIESKRQSLESQAVQWYSSFGDGDVVVKFSTEGGVIVSVDSIFMTCVYNLNEDETAWVKLEMFPELDRGNCKADFPLE